MKLSTSVLFCVASLGACTEGVLSMRVNKVAVHDDPDHPLNRRDVRNDFSDMIANQRFYYTSDVQIGTPAQRVNLLMDTGSSDTWVFSPGTTVSSGQGQSSHPSGNTFDSSKSSTFKSNHTNWAIQYGIGQASGSWGTDKFSIGGSSLKSLSIGVASSVSQVNQGIAGLGRPEAESTNKNGYQYENLPLRLAAEGVIGSAAYSIFMDDINSKSGTILFGGVDHSRYSGSLTALPFDHPKHLAVRLDGIKADGRATQPLLSAPAPAVLDSGTSLSYVDQGTLVNIQVALNANPSFAINEKYYCDCNITSNLIFTFGSAEVKVPAYQFLWPIEEFVSPTVANLEFPQNSCYLGIEAASQDQDFILLGDNMLRSMYVVYDLSNKQIAVANAKGGNQAANIQAITGRTIPGT